jgi:hypothetical protein
VRHAFAILCACACGSTSPSATPDAAAPSTDATDATVPACYSRAQLQAWQAEIDQFGGGYRPTGSPAHQAYIARLAEQLSSLGIADVRRESFSFLKWTPASWSFKLGGGATVELSGYVPYSGTTGPLGITSAMKHVPASVLTIDPSELEQALSDPTAWRALLAARLEASFELLGLFGKIAVFEVPELALSFDRLTGQQLYVNDPTSTVPVGSTVRRADLAAILLVPAMLDALAAAGAVGAVGVLPLPEQAAQGLYAPFFGVSTPNLPAVYVDRVRGAALVQTIANHPNGLARLVLDATHQLSSSDNLIAVLPGTSDEEILIGTHTDGPNSIEDNGTVAILAMASCLRNELRPRTFRFVLSGGHFVASLGLLDYMSRHASELSEHALAVMELEHLGTREWKEMTPGMMSLTGLPELQLIQTSSNQPLVDASITFANRFPRTVVATPPTWGEGQNFRGVPLIQFITMPDYMLVGHMPAITTQFTDYDLMHEQVAAFLDMARELSTAPAHELGVGSSQ